MEARRQGQLKTSFRRQVCECKKESTTFSDAWKAKVIADTGDHYLQPASERPMVEGAAAAGPQTRPKLSIPGVAA